MEDNPINETNETNEINKLSDENSEHCQFILNALIVDLENPFTKLEDIIDSCEFIENQIIPNIEETNEQSVSEEIIKKSLHWISLLKDLQNIQKMPKDKKILELVHICEDNFVVENEEDAISQYAITNALFEALYSKIKELLFQEIEQKEIHTEDDLYRAQELYDDVIKLSIIEAAFVKK